MAGLLLLAAPVQAAPPLPMPPTLCPTTDTTPTLTASGDPNVTGDQAYIVDTGSTGLVFETDLPSTGDSASVINGEAINSTNPVAAAITFYGEFDLVCYDGSAGASITSADIGIAVDELSDGDVLLYIAHAITSNSVGVQVTHDGDGLVDRGGGRRGGCCCFLLGATGGERCGADAGHAEAAQKRASRGGGGFLSGRGRRSGFGNRVGVSHVVLQQRAVLRARSEGSGAAQHSRLRHRRAFAGESQRQSGERGEIRGRMRASASARGAACQNCGRSGIGRLSGGRADGRFVTLPDQAAVAEPQTL